MQRARVGSGSGGPEEIEDGMVDGSFHTPEWHAARLASLNTSHTITWEEFKKKQKEDEMRKGEVEADKDRMMREYRAQLDAERAHKLAHGRNRSSSRSYDKKEREQRFEETQQKKKAFKASSESNSESSSSESSSSDDQDRESRRSKSRSKKMKKEKKHQSKTKHSRGSHEEAADGPVPLSKFFGNWLVAVDGLATRASLARRHLLSEDQTLCVLCGQEKETINHMLLHCRDAQNLWQKLLRWLGIQAALPATVVQWGSSWETLVPTGNKEARSMWGSLFSAACWTLWKCRNEKLFRSTDCVGSRVLWRVLWRVLSCWYWWIRGTHCDFPYSKEDVHRSVTWIHSWGRSQ